MLFAATLFVLGLLTHERVFLGGNDASRFAHIEALVDFGEHRIEQSRYHWTVDKVTVDGRTYTNKPPLLNLLGAAVYLGLQELFGLSFAETEGAVIYWLTLILVGASSAWSVTVFYRALDLLGPIEESSRLLATCAMAAGTVMTSFSVTFNNHTIAAALLLAAFVGALRLQALTAGFFCGFALCIDIVPGLVFAPVFAWILYDGHRGGGLRSFCGMIALWLVVFVGSNWLTLGHPLPPKFMPGGIDSSAAGSSHLFNVVLPSRWTYPLETLFGWHGFFLVSPVLVFGVWGWVDAFRASRPFPRSWILAFAAGSLTMIVGHAIFVGAFGGWSYGFRYLIPIMPMTLLAAPIVIRRGSHLAFAAVLVPSILMALIGAYNPWPPAYEEEDGKHRITAIVTNPVGGNLAGWSNEYFPGSDFARLMARTFISPEESLQLQYLYYFYGSKHDIANARATLRRLRALGMKPARTRTGS